MVSACEPKPAFPIPSVTACVARAFSVPSECIQFPDCSRGTVAGPQDDALSALLFRKISLPLIWILAPLRRSATRARTFCRWKWRQQLWEKRDLLHASCKLAPDRYTAYPAGRVLSRRSSPWAGNSALLTPAGHTYVSQFSQNELYPSSSRQIQQEDHIRADGGNRERPSSHRGSTRR